MTESQLKCLAIIRIRGRVGLSREIEDTFRKLHLNKENHATILDNRSSNRGMVQKVKDYSTWGEISLDTIFLILRERGRIRGDRKITDQFVKEKLGYESIEDLAMKIYNLEVDFWKIDEVRPVLRLHPPKGGFDKETKKPYPVGELGYRGEAINNLVKLMV